MSFEFERLTMCQKGALVVEDAEAHQRITERNRKRLTFFTEDVYDYPRSLQLHREGVAVGERVEDF